MINKKLEHIADVLKENGKNKQVDKEVIIYGLSSAIEHVASISTTIILGYLFGLILESIVFLLSFSFLRTYAGGYHCKKALNCYLMSSGVTILVLSIVKLTHQNYISILSGIMLFSSIPTLLMHAPVETPNKPLDDDEQKYYRRKTITHLVIECILICILFLFKSYSFAYVICIGIMSSSILVDLQKRLVGDS